MFPNIPNIYNIPGLNLPGMNQQNKSKWSEVNPFRTVEGGREYGAGLNKSAGQLYDHFHRKVGLDKLAGNMDTSVQDYGLSQAGLGQSMQDFLNRRNPKPITPPQLPGNIPGKLPGLPPNFQIPPGIFNAGQGMFPGIDFSQIQKQLQGQQPPAPQPAGGQPAKPPNMSAEQYMAICGMPPPNGAPGQPGGGFMGPAPMPSPPQQGGGMMGGPQVPQFQPSLFNMQPQMQQMMRPRPMGV